MEVLVGEVDINNGVLKLWAHSNKANKLPLDDLVFTSQVIKLTVRDKWILW